MHDVQPKRLHIHHDDFALAALSAEVRKGCIGKLVGPADDGLPSSQHRRDVEMRGKERARELQRRSFAGGRFVRATAHHVVPAPQLLG